MRHHHRPNLFERPVFVLTAGLPNLNLAERLERLAQTLDGKLTTLNRGYHVSRDSQGGHMQVVFSIEEFRFLVHILREQNEGDLQPHTSLQSSAAELLEKILGRDFGFSLDELEDLEEILKIHEQKLRRELADPSLAHAPEKVHEEEVLDRVIDRVTEACAMA